MMQPCPTHLHAISLVGARTGLYFPAQGADRHHRIGDLGVLLVVLLSRAAVAPAVNGTEGMIQPYLIYLQDISLVVLLSRAASHLW